MFNIPHLVPPWSPGLQLVNLGQGGPSSHPREQASASKPWPTAYRIGVSGLGAMPRQIFGPLPVVNVNAYTDPRSITNLTIPGITKNPVGG
jgi:hypothetical protein